MCINSEARKPRRALQVVQAGATGIKLGSQGCVVLYVSIHYKMLYCFSRPVLNLRALESLTVESRCKSLMPKKTRTADPKAKPKAAVKKAAAKAKAKVAPQPEEAEEELEEEEEEAEEEEPPPKPKAKAGKAPSTRKTTKSAA